MELEQVSIVITMAIWGICNLFVLFVLSSAAIHRRSIDLIRGGLFLKVLAMTITINSGAYAIYYSLPAVMFTYPLFVWAVTTMGAIGALMICRGLLR